MSFQAKMGLASVVLELGAYAVAWLEVGPWLTAALVLLRLSITAGFYARVERERERMRRILGRLHPEE